MIVKLFHFRKKSESRKKTTSSEAQRPVFESIIRKIGLHSLLGFIRHYSKFLEDKHEKRLSRVFYQLKINRQLKKIAQHCCFGIEIR